MRCPLPLTTLLLLQFIFAGRLAAQETISLHWSATKLSIKQTPFKQVRVLDNRPDTVRVSVTPNARYPITYARCTPPCGKAIADYLQGAVSSLPKSGEKELLVNLLVLKVPLVQQINRRKSKAHGGKARSLQNTLLVTGAVYESDSAGLYVFRLLTDKTYSIDGQHSLADRVAAFCNELLAEAGDYHKYPVTAGSHLSLEQINQHAAIRWQQYAVVADSAVVRNGTYTSFDDFRDNQVSQTGQLLLYNEKDSAWYCNATDHLPFAMACNGVRYLHIGSNRYLPLYKEAGTFAFRVPFSMQDMHAQFALDDLRRKWAAGYSHNSANSLNSADNLLVLVIGFAVYCVVDWFTITKPERRQKELIQFQQKQIQEMQARPQFRKCFVDLDCGDIIYEELMTGL